jgi:DNA polymerase-3 subunit gamma/tau
MIGQSAPLQKLKQYVVTGSVPHFMLFTGPSGCGKTTAARILRKRMKCADIDYVEENASDKGGIDDVRNILEKMSLAPMASPCKVYLLDECHRLSDAAQSSFLKALEDTPKHVYFFFATTHPQKLRGAILSRADVIEFNALSKDHIIGLVKSIAAKEGVELADEVAAKIAEHSDGGARKALQFLNGILGIKDVATQLQLINKFNVSGDAFELIKGICGRKLTWAQIGELLNGLHERKEEPEEIRRQMLGYARTMLCGRDNPFADDVIVEFSKNFFDSGHAGLASACYNAFKAGAKTK